MEHGIQTTPPARSWTEIDWSEHRRFVSVGGQEVNLVEIGEGPVVLFIHGLGGNWQGWLENIPAVAADHRAIAVDLPGFGESAMPHVPITIDFYAKWVVELLGTLNVRRTVIVGNSMGGQIAAEVTLQFPELVERLVLVDPAGISVESLQNERAVMVLGRADRVLAIWSKQVVARSRRLATRRRARKALMALWVAHPERISTPLVTEIAKGMGKPGFATALKGVTAHKISARLAQISCPTLILWGALDRITPVKDAYEFHARIRGSKLVVWPDTGHLSMIERAPEFNEQLRAFLSSR